MEPLRDGQRGRCAGWIEGWSLTITTQVNLSSFAPINGQSAGPASPYPATLVAPATSQTITDVEVFLEISHDANVGELDILLVGPTNQAVMLMSDVAFAPASHVGLTLRDSAPTFLPSPPVPLTSGTYKPTNHGGDADDVQAVPHTGPVSAALSAFNGLDPSGTWKLYLFDDTDVFLFEDQGTIHTWSLRFTTVGLYDADAFFNYVPAARNGPASPYPGTINVSGVAGVITKVTLTLTNVTHTSPGDIDILLVGPGGQNALVLSDVVAPSTANATLTFDDSAAGGLLLFESGTYRPTNNGLDDPFASPAPAPTNNSALSVFNNTNPNGTWSLYVMDDTDGDVGRIASWSLTITASLNPPTPTLTTTPTVTTTATPVAGAEPVVFPGAFIEIPPVGHAVPYPAPINVTGQTGSILNLAVSMSFDHTRPDDLDILLVGPGGQTVMLMSDAGGGPHVAGNIYPVTFDDRAPTAVSNLGPPSVGIQRPANYDGGDPDTFDGPAPAGPHGTVLSVFNGTNPNGLWRLFVMDDAAGNQGSVENWSLRFNLPATPTPTSTTTATLTPTRTPTPTPGVLTNTTLLTIPTAGPASAYPWTITAAGLPGAITKVAVTLTGLTHSFPDDLDILLVGPGGQSVMLMSDAGGGNLDASTVSLTFENGAPPAPQIPDAGPLLSGTYTPTNRVGDNKGANPADTFPGPAPAGPYGALLTAFNGTSPNGDWKLFVVDDANDDAGVITSWALSLTLDPAAATVTPTATPLPAAVVFNSPGFTIPASGPANTYPSTINVAGQTGSVLKVTLSLNSLTHGFPDDLDVLLVGPGGQSVILMSDVGGEAPVGNRTVTFDDSAPTEIPTGSPLANGTFRPTNILGVGMNKGEDGADVFPSPAPAAPYGATLAVFNGTSPNGPWRLFASDDASPDGGVLEGWTLRLSLGTAVTPTMTSTPTPTSSPTRTSTAAPTSSPTRTPTPTQSTVSGHGFTLEGNTNPILTWRAGTVTKSLVIRWAAISNMFTFPGILDPGATTFVDPAAVTEATCYVLMPFLGELSAPDVRGISDLFCMYPNTATGPVGQRPTQFRVALDESPNVTLGWTAPGGQTRYVLQKIRFDGSPIQPLEVAGGEVGFTETIGTTTTCYRLIAFNGNSEMGGTNQVCAAPGVQSFTAGLPGVAAAVERIRGLQGGSMPQASGRSGRN